MDKFDLRQFQETGVQAVRNFFEPEITKRLAALGTRIAESVRAGQLSRDTQMVHGVDVDAEAPWFNSDVLKAVAVQVLGHDPGYFFARVLMKDRHFNGPIQAHQDYPYYGGNTRKLNVFIPLSHCSPENGMLVFYEGSHALGPVERGEIDVARYPECKPICPTLEIGDVLFADFLSWHSSVPATVEQDRIMVQLALLPASDRCSNRMFGGGYRTDVQPIGTRFEPMVYALPSASIGLAHRYVETGQINEARKIARGLALDSDNDVQAHLVLHEIALKSGEDGSGELALAEAALARLGARVAALKQGGGNFAILAAGLSYPTEFAHLLHPERLVFENPPKNPADGSVIFFGPYVEMKPGRYQFRFVGTISGTVALRFTHNFGEPIYETSRDNFDEPVVVDIPAAVTKFEIVGVSTRSLKRLEIQSIDVARVG